MCRQQKFSHDVSRHWTTLHTSLQSCSYGMVTTFHSEYSLQECCCQQCMLMCCSPNANITCSCHVYQECDDPGVLCSNSPCCHVSFPCPRVHKGGVLACRGKGAGGGGAVVCSGLMTKGPHGLHGLRGGQGMLLSSSGVVTEGES